MTRAGRGALLLAVLAGAARPAAAQLPLAPVWDSVATILQAPALPADGYVRYGLPRRDLVVRLGNVPLAVPLAAGAWAGFAGTARDAMVMGDLVVTPAEVAPVEAELLRQRFDLSGVHDHLVGEEPRLTSIHFHGEGAAVDLAMRLDTVLARTATPRPVTAVTAPPVTIDTALVFDSLGAHGRAAGSVAQLSFELVRKKVRWHGRTLVPALALATPVTIELVRPDRAVATGDFAVLAPQVAPVLRAMAAGHLVVTALHGHLVGESPPVYHVHFWADGRLGDVVRGIRAALGAAR